MSRYMNPITACCAAVLMLGLAACGDSKKTTTMMPDPDPPMPMMVSLTDVTATPTAGMAEIDAGAMADIGDITFTCQSGGDDCSVVVAADGTATSTGGMATAANSAAYTARITPMTVSVPDLTDDVMNPAGTVPIAAGASETNGEVTYTCAEGSHACTVTVAADGSVTKTGGAVTAAVAPAYATRKAAERMRTTAAAETKWTEIGNEADQMDDAGLGGSDHVNTDGSTDPNADDPYGLAISRKRGEAATIEITDHDDTLAEDARKFAKAGEEPLPGLIMHVRDNGMGEVEIVVVGTDIEADTGVRFAMWQGRNDQGEPTMPHTLDVSTDTTNDDPAQTFEALAVDENSADVRGLVKSTAFVPGSGSSTQLTFPDDDTATTDMDEAAEVAGTYRGADGKYRCNGTADCTVTVDDEGAITAMSDGWVFIPDMGATSDQPDYDYYHYGFWLKRTTADGDVTYDEVETFAGSSVAASGDVSSVEGAATYEGDAAGVYAMRRGYDSGTGRANDSVSGHFTAKARLTARFGGDTVAAADDDELEGTIDTFVLSGRQTPGWAVKLEKAEIDASTGMVSAGVASDAAPDSTAADGTFSATFHGSTGNANTVQPSSVVGEFNANFENGRVAGAFGARKDD